MRRQRGPRRRSEDAGRPLGRRYLLHERLGRGAMGEVFRATIRDTGESLAAKVLWPDLSNDPELVARFLRERAILTSLSDPHLVAVRDLVVEGDSVAIVMDLVEGQDLRSYLAVRGTLAAGETTRLIAEVLGALGVVHAAGVVHRDVKPENVLVDLTRSPPSARLSDFGIARLARGPSLTELPGVIGTPAYLAPELDGGQSATAAADVYATGVVYSELLTGRPPPATPDPERPAGLPEQAWSVLRSMLALDPAERPAAGDAARALSRLVPTDQPAGDTGGELSTLPQETLLRGRRHDEQLVTEAEAHGRGRKLLVVGLGVAAVLAAVIVAAVALTLPSGHHGSSSRSRGHPTTTLAPAAQASHLVDLINQTRASKGLPALLVNPQLAQAASAATAQLAPSGSADAATVRPKVVALVTPLFPNPAAVSIGYNVVPDATSVDQAYQAELNTPDHLQNYTDPSWNYVGVGVTQKPGGSLYVLEIFVAAGGSSPSETG